MKLVISCMPLRTNACIHARSNAGEIDCTRPGMVDGSPPKWLVFKAAMTARMHTICCILCGKRERGISWSNL